MALRKTPRFFPIELLGALRCPLYPQERTFRAASCMSALLPITDIGPFERCSGYFNRAAASLTMLRSAYLLTIRPGLKTPRSAAASTLR